MNKKPMTLGSLFDGSGGFPLGGLISGITPLWASEVEPFPIRVTSKRIPQMKHLGDISTSNGAEIDPVDIITFGSPCQDMSVAGKRSGLDGERSCLFYEAIRIVKEMRCKTNGEYPRYIVWENVPGAFSSNAGEDFKAVLEAVASVKGDYAVPCPPKGKWTGAGELLGDGFSIAWRCVDAQYWGVPQRRRRIYLVADFNGGCAGKILFESEGLFRNLETSRCPWKRTTGTSEESTPATGIVLNDQGGNRMDVTDDVTCTLRAEAHHPPCVMESAGFCTEHSADSRGIGYEAEKSPTLRAGVVPATVYENHSQDTRYVGPLDVAQTVAATYGTGGNNTDADLEYIVRRLTPTECARLQGFPDWWCADLGEKLPSEEELTRWAEIFETHRKIVGTSSKPKTRKQIFKWLQNPHSDSAEYKMWGNGVALPNVVYVLTGIVYYTQNEGV